MPNIFARKEMKYKITPDQKEEILEGIKDLIKPEEYHQYKICNIYYDTDRYDLFRMSVEKPDYKEKLRLRSYGTPDMNTKVFLELKKKYDGIVYKRRISEPLQRIYQYLEDPEHAFDGNDNINEREIRYLLERYDLKPKVYLSYDREAWIWKEDPNFRFTFDSSMKYRLENVGLENGDDGYPILNDDTIIMELKCTNALPSEFVEILSRQKNYITSFSKIGTVYKEHLVFNNQRRISA